MGTLRNTHTAKMHLPAGDGFPKGGILPANSSVDVSEGYIESIKDNPSVRIYAKAGLLVIESAVVMPEPVIEPPASALGAAAALDTPVIGAEGDAPSRRKPGGRKN